VRGSQIIVVDFSQLAISTLMVELKGAKGADIQIPLVRHMIINTIRSYKMKFGNEYGQMVIACDSRKYWRKTEFEFYKSGRKKVRDDSALDWVAIYAALNQVKAELEEYFPYPVIEVETAEADDVIGALAKYSQTNDLEESSGLFGDAEPRPFLILSGDKDFIQLQKFPNVKQYMPILRKWGKPDVPPSVFLQEHIIMGDKGDGIPNIRSADDTFASGGRQKPIGKRDLEAWKYMQPEDYCTADMLRNYHRNKRLIDLDNIPEDVAEKIIAQYVAQKDTRNRSQLLNFFIANKMKNLIDSIQEF
jgi:hypothetical protein